MKRLVVGLLAHVDAGKTTLSEALLYRGGALRKLGRVDHRDAFLDTDAMERERGITIFSKQARLTLEDAELQLLDTPGHVDFSAEMERTLQVLDYAILVISGTDGVQGHTRTVWRLLERYGVPVFLFVNKMDLAGADAGAVLDALRRELNDSCVAFHPRGDDFFEEAALRDETVLDRYLETGAVSDGDLADLIAARKLFPVWFGSALKLEGVDELLAGLGAYTRQRAYSSDFGARVFKVSRDPQGARLTWLKVTGGVLRVKAPLTNRRPGLPEDQIWEEKADQLRLYSGTKFQTAEEAPAGTVCAVTGLSRTRPGEGLGFESGGGTPALEPVLTYQVLLPEDCDPHTALGFLRMLEEEDPQLHVVWQEQTRQIHVQLMGEVQLEILRRVLADRFGLDAAFGAGAIVYRETVAAPVIGIGHFEPLRHYAEVHLLLEPGPRGSGVRLATACPEDVLDRNWQRLIMTHLLEREQPGVLTGAPLTDVKITLLAGRAHVKHTEGGDFRQATYRAVRQGLMQAENVLLEPWYDFRLEIPAEAVGRAIGDIQRMGGETDAPQGDGAVSVLTGAAPVEGLRDYAAQVTAYTRGRGRLQCALKGYLPCHDQAAAVSASGYDPERDAENPADSVFCGHGAGYNVKWDEVPAHAHVSSGYSLAGPEAGQREPSRPGSRTAGGAPAGGFEQDKELQAIFQRTYGPLKRRDFRSRAEVRRQEGAAPSRPGPPKKTGPEYLLVDGYNVIFAWDELKAVAQDNLDAARKLLMDLLSNFQGFRKSRVILVFDAYKVPRGVGEVLKYHNIHVVYTKESQTADAYIEKATYTLGKEHPIRVVTSDRAEQLIILGHGALRVPASAFKEEVEAAEGQIAAILAKNNVRSNRAQAVKAALERAEKNTAPDTNDIKLRKH